MPVDPGHEFLNVLTQLCGAAAHYTAGAPYPPITNSGFVEAYNHSSGAANLAEIMKCFDTPRQLPVVFTLAKEFALCDRWYASMPGPTWPNRIFAHAASSGGLDHHAALHVERATSLAAQRSQCLAKVARLSDTGRRYELPERGPDAHSERARAGTLTVCCMEDGVVCCKRC
jgi:hypothetical protein